MSQKNSYQINCPKCGLTQPVELHESVNVQVNPQLRDELLGNRLNLVVCTNCKATFRVDKSLLYNDPAHQIMIYLIPLKESDYDQGERLFAESLQRLNGALPKDFVTPGVSLVFNRFELVERIFLVEAGLNERIIEYIKYLIYTKNLTQMDPRRKNLLFDAQDSTEKALCFVIQDVETRKLESAVQYDRNTYRVLCEMFDRDDQTPTLLELFPGPHISARSLLLKELAESTRPGTPKKPDSP